MENPNQALIQQNNFLASQNKLLEQINGMLMRQNPTLQSNEIFIENIDRDEMRNGFLVTSHRKKLWNVQIGLIKEFDRICKKHNLKWFACGGTLLGAARHKGFIPWDDDVDIGMFRPDYNKFTKIAAEEIKYPYFFDNYYNHRLESDETPDPLKNLPYFNRTQEATYFNIFFPSFPIIKIRDSRTTMIEFADRKDANQGIWIDIFPFDIMPPFAEKKREVDFATLRELMLATFRAESVRKALNENQPSLISKEELKKFLKLPFRARGMEFDKFAEKVFFNSEKVGDIRAYGLSKGWSYDTKYFDEIVYLPFETIEIAAPKNWDQVLTSQYGDWRKLVFSTGHVREFFYSADIPYTEYYRNSAFMR